MVALAHFSIVQSSREEITDLAAKTKSHVEGWSQNDRSSQGHGGGNGLVAVCSRRNIGRRGRTNMKIADCYCIFLGLGRGVFVATLSCESLASLDPRLASLYGQELTSCAGWETTMEGVGRCTRHAIYMPIAEAGITRTCKDCCPFRKRCGRGQLGDCD